jgi:hypothetical protein
MCVHHDCTYCSPNGLTTSGNSDNHQCAMVLCYGSHLECRKNLSIGTNIDYVKSIRTEIY